MGNDTLQWRAAIGNFCGKLHSVVLKYTFHFTFHEFYLLWKKYISYTCTFCKFFLTLVTESTLNIPFSAVVLLLVIMSGDVQQNPGPHTSDPLITTGLGVMQLNIRSIRHKLDFIKNELMDYDILCFTETHLTNLIDEATLELESYGKNSYRRDKTAHSGG